MGKKKFYNNNTISIVITILFLFLFVTLWNLLYLFTKTKINQKFYSCRDIYPELYGINHEQVLSEINKNMQNSKWIDWPEYGLYEKNNVNGSWKILPFYGFNTWVKSNCSLFPKLTNFLKTLPNLQIAILSKLEPNTTLVPHYGWGNHSNNVLRCHYGIKLPNNTSLSYVGVKENENDREETMNHIQNDWIVFDDSKLHYASNKSKTENRIVLIVDLIRPNYVEKGKSNSEDTKELLDLPNEMKKLNVQS